MTEIQKKDSWYITAFKCQFLKKTNLGKKAKEAKV